VQSLPGGTGGNLISDSVPKDTAWSPASRAFDPQSRLLLSCRGNYVAKSISSRLAWTQAHCVHLLPTSPLAAGSVWKKQAVLEFHNWISRGLYRQLTAALFGSESPAAAGYLSGQRSKGKNTCLPGCSILGNRSCERSQYKDEQSARRSWQCGWAVQDSLRIAKFSQFTGNTIPSSFFVSQ